MSNSFKWNYEQVNQNDVLCYADKKLRNCDKYKKLIIILLLPTYNSIFCTQPSQNYYSVNNICIPSPDKWVAQRITFSKSPMYRLYSNDKHCTVPK